MAEPRSFYFFDFDKNIMQVKVPFVLTNTKDGSTKEISGREYFEIKADLGKRDPWKEWSGKYAMRNYRDLPGVPPEGQPFVRQIEETIRDVDRATWQGPAWGIFVHACNTDRPFSLITARGHADDTVKAGFDVFKKRGFIERTPNYLTIFNVSYPPTVKALGGTGEDDEGPRLKRVAILRSVDKGVEKYGDAPHRFGMSDDTMMNVEFIADAMAECKKKYPNMRFFVISTNLQHMLKAEIFPMNIPVTGHGDPAGKGPLESHLED